MNQRPVYIAGDGNIGRALKQHLIRRFIPFDVLWIDTKLPQEGLLFLAVPDTEVSRILALPLPARLTVIYFAGSLAVQKPNTFLLHPFASIGPETDLTGVPCTLWGDEPRELENWLRKAGITFFPAGKTPGTGYHTAAVLSGNLTQFAVCAAIELLQREGLSSLQAQELIKALIDSSLVRVFNSGIPGITGPAARNDLATIAAETDFLANLSPDAAALYRKFSTLISQAVIDGHIFK